MLEPLIWMFKVQDFKKHFLILLANILIFNIIGFVSFYFLRTSDVSQSEILMIIVYIFALCCFILPALFTLGYFWNLVDEIINRGWDISSSNIYGGKIKAINIINLPEIKVFKFIWRGIASIVASILLYIPIVFIIIFVLMSSKVNMDFYGINFEQAKIFYLCIYLFMCLFIPALAWNYARRDSIVAVWNIPKAVFIMGTYTWSYIAKIVIFIVLAIINSLIITWFLSHIGFHYEIGMHGIKTLSIESTNIHLTLILGFLFSSVINIYWLFVNAYLLGTIAPPGENY